jgi:hypothetical protein
MIRDPGMTQAATEAMIEAAMGPALAPVSVEYSPASGATVTLPAVPNDLFVTLTPAADLATLTLVLPPESADRENQALRIRSTRNIVSLVITGATTVDNADVMLSANGVTVFFKFAPNTWSRTV